MRHIEEHILELHVLGSEKVADRREEILSHLGECHGCRHLAEQMAEFYREAETELKNLSASEPHPDTSLARVHRDIQKLYEPAAPAIPLRTPTTMERFGIFVRRHPVVAGGGVVSFALAAALILMTITNFRQDTNPVRFFLDEKSSMIQVYNKENQLLWQMPSTDLMRASEQGANLRRIQIADIDGDGKNEVLTTLSLMDEDPDTAQTLKVLDGTGRFVWIKSFSHPFQYGNRNYGPEFHPGRLIADNFGSNKGMEILVEAANSRSPFRIVRLNCYGEELGAYWHQGHMKLHFTIDVDGDGVQEILVGGVNDLNDSTMGEFPALVVLNPRQIASQGKAPICPDFQLPLSKAEVYYLRFPIPDIFSVPRILPTVHQIQSMSDRMYMVGVGGVAEELYGFHYVLDRTMHVLEVKSNNLVDRLHARLKEEGTITSTLDRDYLENLRKGVRYWDGEEWRKEAVKVKHGEKVTFH